MAKPKQVSTAKYEYFTPPETGGMTALKGFNFEVDPTFGQASASLKRRRNEARNGLTGPYVSPEAQRNAALADENEIGMQEMEGRRQQNYDANQQQFGKLLSIAQLEKPELKQTSEEKQEKGGGWSTALNVGMQVAGMAMM